MRAGLAGLAAAALVALNACGGGGNPVGPAPLASRGVALKGTVVGTAGSGSTGSAQLGALGARALAGSGAITVSVQENPAITTTVANDGTFTLRGLPEGSFTLVFTRDGAPLGTLTFGSVLPNQELTITVSVSGGSVVLLEEERDGIGHGDVEIEGLVGQVLALDASGESRFLIDGRTVLARPGDTAIREGNSARGVEDVTVGRRVHVKGIWLEPAAGTQAVLAYEIVLQGDAPATSPTPSPSSCMIQGSRVGDGIELEGEIVSGGGASFQLRVDGGRATNPVDVLAGSASFECTPRSGPNAPTPEQCRASAAVGAKVHVSGTLDACTASSAQVSASKVTVQK